MCKYVCECVCNVFQAMSQGKNIWESVIRIFPETLLNLPPLSSGSIFKSKKVKVPTALDWQSHRWSRIPRESYESQIFLVPSSTLWAILFTGVLWTSETLKCCFSRVLTPRQLLECGSQGHHLICTLEYTWTITPLYLAPRVFIICRTLLQSWR